MPTERQPVWDGKAEKRSLRRCRNVFASPSEHAEQQAKSENPCAAKGLMASSAASTEAQRGEKHCPWHVGRCTKCAAATVWEWECLFVAHSSPQFDLMSYLVLHMARLRSPARIVNRIKL